jgi:hypothetical protein
MTIEVETDAGDAMLLEGIADKFEERAVLIATETMAENNHRALLAWLQFGLLNKGRQLAMIAIDANTLAFLSRYVCASG